MVPMMSYLLEYCELPLLYPVGLAVFGCSQILQRYVCKLIGGDGVLIYVVYSYLLLLDIIICHTIGGGSIHINFIVTL